MFHKSNQQVSCNNAEFKIGIIGAGIAGSTIALRLAELGLNVSLLEKGSSLVNGPPICHLHAGGNLYREISEQQCLTLLRQSIDTLKLYQHSANVRPTIVAIPTHDEGAPQDLFPRLAKLQHEYQKLVAQNPDNAVLGEPDDYYRVYDEATLRALATQDLPMRAQSHDDWVIPFAKHLDFSTIKFPVILVQEYGLSVFRLAATATLAMEKLANCQVHTNTRISHIEKTSDGWQVFNQQGACFEYDFLINACGFRTGEIDDILALKRSRLVEFKSAYVSQWPQTKACWPEVIFYGKRGTPQGMAQLTPYPDGYFQLHGMTEEITLFNDGLAASCEHSAQPKLPQPLLNKIDDTWQHQHVLDRTMKSIQHLAQFLPQFEQASLGGKPLFGAQQIPGDDPALRAADVTFDGLNYARAEIVKASSAIDSADRIIEHLLMHDLISLSDEQASAHQFPITHGLNLQAVTDKAVSLAKERNYPIALALPITN